MNPKLVYLIAAQFGIIAGLVSWQVSSRFFTPVQRTTEAIDDSEAAPFRSIAHAPIARAVMTNQDYQRPYAPAFRPERERVIAVQQQPVATDEYDDQETAAQPYAQSDRVNNFFSATPNYYDPVQQPVVDEPDYVTPYLYAEPFLSSVVVIDNSRRRFRSTRHFDSIRTHPHQFTDGGRRDFRPAPLPPTRAPLLGIRPRGNNAARVQTGIQPRRAPVSGPGRSNVPGSSKTAGSAVFVP